MIPLIFPPYPEKELTKAEFERLIDLFLVKDEAVWLRPFIQTPFLESSNCKCAYCERLPKDGGGDVQIDHYLPKTKENIKTKQPKLYTELAIWWYNLIPICKNCNTRKGTYDSGRGTPLLNPFLDDLQTHLQMDLSGDLIGKTESGKLTVRKAKPKHTGLDLNDYIDVHNGLAAKRAEIIRAVRGELASIKETVDKITSNNPQQTTRDDIFNRLCRLMERITPQNPKIRFIAAHATALLHPNSDYYEIRKTMKAWKPQPKTAKEINTLNNLERTIQQYSLA